MVKIRLYPTSDSDADPQVPSLGEIFVTPPITTWQVYAAGRLRGYIYPHYERHEDLNFVWGKHGYISATIITHQVLIGWVVDRHVGKCDEEYDYIIWPLLQMAVASLVYGGAKLYDVINTDGYDAFADWIDIIIYNKERHAN
jgi:hypothetical protein